MTSTRRPTMLLAAAILAAVPVSSAVAKKPKPQYGLFGTIHGKPFKAANNGENNDPCVAGIYKPADGIFVMAALECRKSLKRRVQKKNYKIIALSCAHFDPAVPIVPPYTIPCYASGYTEAKTGRFGSLKSQLVWNSSFILDGPYPTSGLNLRIESFDGTVLQGKLFGTFDMPQLDATGTADISGEATLSLPVRVQ